MFYIHTLCVLLASIPPPPASAIPCPVITNCIDLSKAISGEQVAAAEFDITAAIAVILRGKSPRFLLRDSSGDVVIQRASEYCSEPFKAGDTIRICGHVSSLPYKRTISYHDVKVIRHGESPPPIEMTASQITKPYPSRLYVCLSATIQDVFRDEIDPDFTFLTIISNGEVLYAALYDEGSDLLHRDSLIGAQAKITGVVPISWPSDCINSSDIRRHLGFLLDIPSPQCITIVSPAISDPFDVPTFDTLKNARPSDIPRAGKRRTTGIVLATWQENSLLLKTPCGGISRVDLARGPLPHPGDIIEAVGFPSSDLFYINLIRASWRPTTVREHFAQCAITNTSADKIALDDKGRTHFKPSFHGQLVSLSGLIIRQQNSSSTTGLIEMEQNGLKFTVDLSTLPGSANELTEGCLVSVTGICVLDMNDWRPNDVFPRIRGFKIVPRSPNDIRVLSRPPWWTPRRFAIALAVALTVLLFSAVINLILRKLVRRRERELKDEIVAHVETELKIQERTRLAIELHDSISQNLTGVALELRTIDNSDAAIPTAIRHHLDVAERTLESCRDELRYCLWDLRNNTLEQDDVGEAIRRTLKPHIGQALLTVRFNVARDILTDNTTHTIFRTIRELATNAVRHGHATAIRVAGCIEGDNLLFSVADNGCGFDADNCPGVEEGHYGLLGVRERIESAGGIFTIVSGPNGTKATAALPTHERTIS